MEICGRLMPVNLSVLILHESTNIIDESCLGANGVWMQIVCGENCSGDYYVRAAVRCNEAIEN